MLDGKFYVVLRAPGQPDWRNVVTKAHSSLEPALAEAARLCRETGKRFIVLAAVAWCSPAEAPVVWHDDGFPDA